MAADQARIASIHRGDGACERQREGRFAESDRHRAGAAGARSGRSRGRAAGTDSHRAATSRPRSSNCSTSAKRRARRRSNAKSALPPERRLRSSSRNRGASSRSSRVDVAATRRKSYWVRRSTDALGPRGRSFRDARDARERHRRRKIARASVPGGRASLCVALRAGCRCPALSPAPADARTRRTSPTSANASRPSNSSPPFMRTGRIRDARAKGFLHEIFVSHFWVLLIGVLILAANYLVQRLFAQTSLWSAARCTRCGR